MSSPSSLAPASTVEAAPSKYLPLANWLRSGSRLKWVDSIVMEYGKRVDVFVGKDLVDALMNGRFKANSELEKYSTLTREEIIEVFNSLIEEKFFVRVIPIDIEKKISGQSKELRVSIDSVTDFDVDASFMWVYEPHNPTALFKVLASIGLIIGACCFKIWPVWMRIVVWWLSLIMLVTLITMMVFHLVSGPLFFIVGLRGLYFMPNLFDDEVDFFDTFAPLFGYGGEHQQRWREEREAQRAARLRLRKRTAAGASGAAAAAEEEEEAAKDKAKNAPGAVGSAVPTGFAGRLQAWLRGMSGWQFGYLNAAVFIIVGIAVSNWFGFFMPENVPEFILSPGELYDLFPSLAPPTADNNANTPVPEPEPQVEIEPEPLKVDLDLDE